MTNLTRGILYALGFTLVPAAFGMAFVGMGWFVGLIIAAMVALIGAMLIEYEPDDGFGQTVFGTQPIDSPPWYVIRDTPSGIEEQVVHRPAHALTVIPGGKRRRWWRRGL